MSLAYIRDVFHVPARYGARVTVEALDAAGTVTGSEGDYVQVAVDGVAVPVFVHPTQLEWTKETR